MLSRFYMPKGLKSEYKRLSDVSYKRSEPLQVAAVENATVLTPQKDTVNHGLDKATYGLGGVIDSEDRFIDYSLMDAGKCVTVSNLCRKRFGGRYDIEASEVIENDREVIYIGLFWPQWGHFLVDIITRLWYALENELPVVFIRKDKELYGNYLELIELLGISKDRIIYVDKPTRFKKVYVPEPAFYPGKYYTDKYNAMIDRAVQEARFRCSGKQAFSKVYFSRTRIGSAEIGEISIEKVMKDNGFEIFYPETLSAAEQIYYVNSSEVFAAVEGTISHNSVFASERTKQIVFLRSIVPIVFQFQINEMKNISADYVYSTAGNLPLIRKNGFLVEPRLLCISRYFKKYAAENGIGTGSASAVDFCRHYLVYVLKWIKKFVKVKILK
ncbi:glycosyltransferase 61 family protein [Butyrivibrio sp. AE3009]|uniref:glycosyltransferase 61 family protein n=1 Tax=Butyrivibrio sp. AE3009 TaxID=1280666 RepID=UPI0009DB738E|nr:glycosyltransferase family 61 protein [Butyrivibrio sp. AE3009]